MFTLFCPCKNGHLLRVRLWISSFSFKGDQIIARIIIIYKYGSRNIKSN